MRKSERFGRVREYLDQVRKADEEVIKLEMRRENLQMLATDIANHMTGASTGGSSDKDRTGRIMAEIDETEQQIKAAKEKAQRKREKVGTAIQQISNPVSQKAIMLHYLENWTWKEIAGEIRYSPIQSYRYRIAGYAEVERFLDQENS